MTTPRIEPECPKCGLYQPAGALCVYCTGEEKSVSLEEWARGRSECEVHGRELVHCDCPTPEWVRERIAQEFGS